jgi:hypothetical protein
VSDTKSTADAYTTLDNLINGVLDDHRIDRWEVDTIKGGSWVICKCGQVEIAEEDHRTHVAIQVTSSIEEHKSLVFDLPSSEDHASQSRDFGRGFNHAVRLMKESLDNGRFKHVEVPTQQE